MPNQTRGQRAARRVLRSTHDEGARFSYALESAQRGQEFGFEHLYDSLFPRLVNYARARHHRDPTDLASDVLLKVFTRLDQFEGNEAQFHGWVFRVAQNTIIDAARKRAVRPIETLVDLTPTRAAGENPESSALSAVGLDDLLAQLDVLTADQRDVVLLRVVADLTITSVAEILDKTPEATKALQRRAFARLADALTVDRWPVVSARVG